MPNNNLPANNDDDNRIVQLTGEDADPSDALNVSLNQAASLLPVPATSLISLATAGPDDFASFFTLRNKNKKPDRWKDMARNRVYCVDWCSIKCNQATHFVKMTAGPIGMRNIKIKDDRGFDHYCLDTKDVVPVLNIPMTLWNKCYSLLNPITLSLTLANFAKPPYVWVTIPGPCIYIPFLFWKGNEDINFMVSAIPPLLRNVGWMCTNLYGYWNTQNLTKDCTLTCLWGGEFTIYDSGQDAKPIPYDMVTGLIGPDIGAMLHNIIGVAGNFFPGGAKGLLMQAGAGILDSVVSGFENAGENEGFSWQAFGQGVLMTGVGMVVGAGSSKMTSKLTSMKAVTKWLSGPTMQRWSGRLNRLSNMTNPVQIGHDQIISFRSKRLPPDVQTAAQKVINQAETRKTTPDRIVTGHDLQVVYAQRKLSGQSDKTAMRRSKIEQFFDTHLGAETQHRNEDANRLWQIGKAIKDQGGKTPEERAHLVNAIKDKNNALEEIHKTERQRNLAKLKADDVKRKGGKKLSDKEKAETTQRKINLETERDRIKSRHSSERPKPKDPGPEPTFSESESLKQKRKDLQEDKAGEIKAAEDSRDADYTALKNQKDIDLGNIEEQRKKDIEAFDLQCKKDIAGLEPQKAKEKDTLKKQRDAEIAASDPKEHQRINDLYRSEEGKIDMQYKAKEGNIRREYEVKKSERNRQSETDKANRERKYQDEKYQRGLKFNVEENKINTKYQPHEEQIVKDSRIEKQNWEQGEHEQWRKDKLRYNSDLKEQKQWDIDDRRLKELEGEDGNSGEIGKEKQKLDDSEAIEKYDNLQKDLTKQMEAYNNAIKILNTGEQGFDLPEPSRWGKILNFLTQEGKDDAAVGISNLLLMFDSKEVSKQVSEIVIKYLWSLIKDKEGDIEEAGGDDASDQDDTSAKDSSDQDDEVNNGNDDNPGAGVEPFTEMTPEEEAEIQQQSQTELERRIQGSQDTMDNIANESVDTMYDRVGGGGNSSNNKSQDSSNRITPSLGHPRPM